MGPWRVSYLKLEPEWDGKNKAKQDKSKKKKRNYEWVWKSGQNWNWERLGGPGLGEEGRRGEGRVQCNWYELGPNFATCILTRSLDWIVISCDEIVVCDPIDIGSLWDREVYGFKLRWVNETMQSSTLSHNKFDCKSREDQVSNETTRGYNQPRWQRRDKKDQSPKVSKM